MNNTLAKDFVRYAQLDHRVSPIVMSQYGNYISPNILEERDIKGHTMDVFNRLLMDRIIFLGVPINADVANIVQAQLLYLDSISDKDISLYLNTPGGEVISGLAIYDTMQLIKSDVSTTCAGMAASMGSILLCGGEPGKRNILPHSKVMIHQPLGGVSGQASDILIEAKEIEKCREDLYKILATNCNQPYDKVFADADRNYWMTADEALAYGMVDNIIKK
jgi:ATP-dependent Clp protease protease subunit